MRYPFITVPGIPYVPPVSVGVVLSNVPPAPSIALSSGPVVAVTTQAFWALHPFTGTGEETLSVTRGNGGQLHTTSVPTGAFIFDGEICAIVKNAPAGAFIDWDVTDPSALVGSGFFFNRLSTSDLQIGFDSTLSYATTATGNRWVGRFTRSYTLAYPAWQLAPLFVTASVDGVALRTLRLDLSAIANSGI